MGAGHPTTGGRASRPLYPRAGAARRAAPLGGGALRLIAAGVSDRESAAALSLSLRTVERHVANRHLKYGTHSKAEATACALCRGFA